MWFIHQQLNSFLNLGMCKEYPIMARPKNPPSGNPDRPEERSGSRTSKKQTATGSSPTPGEVKAEVAATTPAAIKTEPRTFEVRKTETRKTETRKNVFPINLEEEIRRRAYELYEQRGYSSGGEADDWLAAEREVLQRYHQHSA